MSRASRDACVRYHPLSIILSSSVVGAAIDRLLQWPWTLELTLAIVAAIAWRPLRHCTRGIVPLLLLACFSTALSHHVAWRLTSRADLHACLEPQPISGVVDLIVTEAPRLRRESARRDTCNAEMFAWATRIRDGQRWRTTRGKVQLTVKLPLSVADRFAGQGTHNRVPAYVPGDRVRVFGELQTHPPAMNPGDWDPSMSRRTRRESLLRVACPQAMTPLQRANWCSWRRCRWQIRQGMESRLRRWLAPRQADLAVALLLGNRDAMDFQQRQTFIHSGTSHLLALSGLHVGLLASVVWMMGRVGLLSRRATCLLAAGTALAYLIVAGPRPSLVRATVLVVAMAAGRWLGRPRAAWNALALAALVLVVCDPSQVFDTGAQLSFLAVAALCRWGRLAPRELSPIEQLVASSRSFVHRVVRNAAVGWWRWLTLSAVVWIATAPIAVWRFGLLAPVGILLNPLAGPLVAVSLYGAILVNAFHWCPTVADAAGRITSGALLAVQSLAQWGASLPGGHWQLASPPASWAVAGCVLLGGWATATTWPRRSLCAVAMTLWLAWGAACQFPSQADGLTVTVLAVGHGGCIVIRTPARKVWVFDAGRLGSGALVSRALGNALRLCRDDSIDGLIISHEDADHYNAAPRILQTIPTRRVLIGPRMLRQSHSPSAGVRELIETLRQTQVPVQTVYSGSTVWLDADVAMEVLHPPRVWGAGNADNADSLVVRLRHRGRGILLTGDVEGPGLSHLLSQSVRADVLLAPHHGSPNSQPAHVARWCRAKWVVVSSGHLRTELDGLNAHVFQTARDGAITIRVDDAGVTVSGWRSR